MPYSKTQVRRQLQTQPARLLGLSTKHVAVSVLCGETLFDIGLTASCVSVSARSGILCMVFSHGEGRTHAGDVRAGVLSTCVDSGARLAVAICRVRQEPLC